MYSKNIANSFLASANIPMVYNILTESNDNLIMQWYSDKLIRLPIRIGTLDFHEITDAKLTKKYHINVLTEKSKETVERSYKITKFFTEYLKNIDNPDHKDRNRRRAEIKVEALNKIDPENGILDRFIKLTLLNYSKWNQNKYNNYLVEYRVCDENLLKNPFKKAFSSEILLEIEASSKLEMRFYFPEYSETDYSKNKISYTSWEMDFSQIV